MTSFPPTSLCSISKWEDWQNCQPRNTGCNVNQTYAFRTEVTRADVPFIPFHDWPAAGTAIVRTTLVLYCTRTLLDAKSSSLSWPSPRLASCHSAILLM